MIRLLRNREIRNTMLWLILLCGGFTAAAFFWHPPFGWFVLLLSIVFALLYSVTTLHRYRRIAALSEEIDRVLHGAEATLSLAGYSEGELGVLQSELQKMTVRLREQQQLLQNDKVQLADAIADISHQIRTPLTAVNLLVQLLCEEKDDERRTQLTRELLSLLTRMDWLITSLLKMSRLEAGTVKFQCEAVPLYTLIHRAIAPLAVTAELRCQTVTVEAEGEFFGDVAWTGEALLNIVKNCTEHTPCGGRIMVTGCENALYAEIRVCDSGGGIDPADMPHIFDRFYKGKNAGDQSFGVGLALARRIVTAQSGTLTAENGADGAIFTMRFYKSVV